MKKTITILSFLILLCAISSCSKRSISQIPLPPPPPPSPEDTLAYREYIKDLRCSYLYRLNSSYRRDIFPFSEASTVELVSYSAGRKQIDDSTYMPVGGLPVIKNKIDFDKFNERIVLTENQIDSLTNILYNFSSTYKFPAEEHLASVCESMNAILFLDKKGKCYAYVELWFGGPDFVLFPSEINIGEFCTGKYDMLKDFFRSVGIKDGFDSSSYEY